MESTKTHPPLAIVGPPAGGKGTANEFFVAQGYNPVVTADFIRDELATLGNTKPTRDDHGEHARAQRSQHGPGYFIERGLKQIPAPHLIEGCRAPGEIDYLVDHDIIIVAVVAPLEQRYQWALQRASSRDNLTLKQFREDDRRDHGYVQNDSGGWVKSTDPAIRNVDYAVEHAHAIIHNDGDPSDLHAALAECWRSIQVGHIGPGHPVVHYGSSISAR